MKNEPVAWGTGKYEDKGEDFMFPNTRQAHIDHPQSETHIFFPIPLYTHPAKEEAEQQSYQEQDGCPTELAVLQRFWRKAQKK